MSSQRDVVERLEGCIRELKDRMTMNFFGVTMNFFKFSDEMNQFLILGSRHQLAKIITDGTQVGDHFVKPSTSAHNIGVVFQQFDANMQIDGATYEFCV